MGFMKASNWWNPLGWIGIRKSIPHQPFPLRGSAALLKLMILRTCRLVGYVFLFHGGCNLLWNYIKIMGRCDPRISTKKTQGPSKIEWDLANWPRSVSCDRAIRYSGFCWVRETWVRLLEISWHRIHGTDIFSCIYHKNQPFMYCR